MMATGNKLARAFVAVVLGCTLAAAPSTSWARDPGVQAVKHMEPQGANQGKAAIDVLIVRADKSGKVDPRLKSLQRQLSFTNFTGFKVVSEDAVKLSKGQSDTVPGGAGYKVKLKLVKFEGKKASVRLQILRGAEARVDTTVMLPAGRAFTVKGPKVDGGAMIYVMTYR